MLKMLARAAAIVALLAVLSFTLYLGLQVRHLYGNIGLTVAAALVGACVYFGIINSRSRPQ